MKLAALLVSVFVGSRGQGNIADTEASVEIRLSPPRHPLPAVSGKIELLERLRRMAEERQTGKLLKAYDEELTRSRRLITGLIQKALSVFDDPAVVPPASLIDIGDRRDSPGRIWVSVEESPAIDGQVLNRMEAIEKRNGKYEAQIYQGAVDDMHEVTRHTLQQLNESLVNLMLPVIHTGSVSSFIALAAIEHRCNELQAKYGADCDAKPHAHKISVFADRNLYPTVESLFQDMLKRRKVDEDLFQARSLALMAKLAQEQSQIAEDLLRAAAATITVNYGQVIRAVNMTSEEIKAYDLAHPKKLTPNQLPR